MPDKIKTHRYKLKTNLTADCKKNFAKNEKDAEITPFWQKGDRETSAVLIFVRQRDLQELEGR